MITFLMGLLKGFNRLALKVSAGLLIATSLLLTYAVIVRYFFKWPTDWQDEVALFMLLAVVFLCAAYVQSIRGHVAIDLLNEILPFRANKIRAFLVDVGSLLFCAFFSWKSWTLLMEAINEGQTTTSSLESPLWIPYSVMGVGMSFLTLQITLQIVVRDE